MSFRNICLFIPSEVSCTKLFEVQDDRIVEANTSKSLPTSTDYNLQDLLASGVKVAPVDPTIVHDSSSTNAVAKNFVENYVEPSNSEEE